MNLSDGYYGSPRWTYEILDCAMPMTFDTYSNCAHQCEPADRLLMTPDLRYRRAGEIRPGDKLMGFQRRPGSTYIEWVESTAEIVSRRVAPIIEVALEDGSTFECTTDHHWFTGRHEPDLMYKPASTRAGRGLHVLRLPVLPEIAASPAYMRGYIKGVWEGDGTVSGTPRLAMADTEPLARVASYLILLGLGEFTARPFSSAATRPMQAIYLPVRSQAAQLVTGPYENTAEFWDGWLAGMIDAEGGTPLRSGTSLRIFQYPVANPETFERIGRVLNDRGFPAVAEQNAWRILGGALGGARLAQQVLPAVQRKRNPLLGSIRKDHTDKLAIVGIRQLGSGEVVSISTSTGNYMLDGAMSRNCVYCFAFFQRAIGTTADDYLHHKVKAVNVDRIKRMFTDPDQYAGQFAWYIKNRMVLQWGGLSDAFDWYERKFRKSLELLRFFREIDYPLSISTKGVWFLDDPEYVEAFTGARNIQMKQSIITMDAEKAKKLEAGTPTPQKRFESLRRLKEIGVGVTTVRFRPYVLGVSDLTDAELVQAAKDAGVDSLTTELLCLESRASTTAKERYRVISEVCGFDVLKFYREQSTIGSGLLRLNYEIKRPLFERLERLCAAAGIAFYVSDAHHKERSAGAGCCGLPDHGPLSNINRGQYTQAIVMARQSGSVRWSDIAPFAVGLQEIPYATAAGFNLGGTDNRANRRYHTMFDFMHEIWNDPKSGQSPARYFGGALVPGGVDELGDIIYLYNKPFVEEGRRVETVLELKALLAGVEETRKDGQAHGHVAFPVYVLCPDQDPKKATTLALMAEARINVTAFVNPADVPAYEAAFVGLDIASLPAGLNKADQRQFMLDYARSEMLEAVWLLDGGIRGFYVVEKEKPLRSNARAVLSKVEGIAGSYQDVAVAGPARIGALRPNRQFIANVGARNCMLVRCNIPVAFDSALPGLQDSAFCVAALEDGLSTIEVNACAIDYTSPPVPAEVHSIFQQRNESFVSLRDGVSRVHWNLFNAPLRTAFDVVAV